MKPFMKASYALAAAEAVIVKSTGETVQLSFVDKHLYNWCYSQYTHLKGQGNEFFHNQSDIAMRCCASVSAVEKFVSKMSKAGILLKKQKKLTGFIVSNSYEVLDLTDSRLFQFVFNKDMPKSHIDFMLSELEDKGKAVGNKNTSANKINTYTGYTEEDDPDIPF